MLSPGSRIDDRYEIIDALGAGGMGAVYRARRLHLCDEVAIKVMQPSPDPDPEDAEPPSGRTVVTFAPTLTGASGCLPRENWV